MGGGAGYCIFLGKDIFMIIMIDLIYGWIWVNFTNISWGVALRCLPPKFSHFILRCCREFIIRYFIVTQGPK